MANLLRVYIQLRGYGARGPRYQVRMNRADGLILIDATTEPLFDAARALLSKGIKGKLQLWDDVRPYWRMQGDIEHMASKTVSETDAGICLRKYAERTVDGNFKDEGTDDAPPPNDHPCVPAQASEAMEAA